MAQTLPPKSSSSGPDQALVHQFIRLAGRRPTAEELLNYAQAQPLSGTTRVLPLRARRGLAHRIAQL